MTVDSKHMNSCLARSLNDPKPLVVGIAWVVRCAELVTRVDETKYLISLEHENIAGVKKVGTSLMST